MFSSLGSHLNFAEYFLMVVSCKFIRNLEVAIKARERYSSNLGKAFRGGVGMGDHFQVKLRSEVCYLDFQNIFQNRLCYKSCYEIFIK